MPPQAIFAATCHVTPLATAPDRRKHGSRARPKWVRQSRPIGWMGGLRRRRRDALAPRAPPRRGVAGPRLAVVRRRPEGRSIACSHSSTYPANGLNAVSLRGPEVRAEHFVADVLSR